MRTGIAGEEISKAERWLGIEQRSTAREVSSYEEAEQITDLIRGAEERQ